MPTINVAPKQMHNGDVVTSYTDTVGTASTTFTFLKPQGTVVMTNKGNDSISYTIGSSTGTLLPNAKVTVSEPVSQLVLNSLSKTQQFEVWSEELGSAPDDNVYPYSKWSGKKWTLLGDSITWYDGNPYPSGAICNGYPSISNKILKFKTIDNHGVSGASMAESSQYPTYTSIYDTGRGLSYADVDVVTIFAGTNDFGLNVPLGTLGTTKDSTYDNTTFYGAYKHLLDFILLSKPTIKIYLFTPLQRNRNGNEAVTNTIPLKVSDYAQAVVNLGQMYGIPTLDLFSKSGFTDKTLGAMAIDGLHPNDIGHAKISDLITNFMLQNQDFTMESIDNNFIVL